MSNTPETSSIEKFSPWKALPAAFEALKQVKGCKEASFWEKVGLFWDAFSSELEKLDVGEERITQDAEQALSKPIEETRADAQENVSGSSLEENEQKVVADMEGLIFDKLGATKAGNKAFDKIAQTKDGESPPPFQLPELASLSVATCDIALELKKRYPTQEKLQKAFDEYIEYSGKTAQPLYKIFTPAMIPLFNIDAESDGVKILNAFGINLSAGDYLEGALGKFGLGGTGGGEAMEKAELLKCLTKPTFPRREEVANFLKQYIFKNTSDIGRVADLINKLSNSNEADTAKSAELITLIDPEDLIRLGNISNSLM